MSIIPPPGAGSEYQFRSRFNRTQRTWTEFHKDEDFEYTIGQGVPCRVNEMDDVGMAFEQSLEWDELGQG